MNHVFFTKKKSVVEWIVVLVIITEMCIFMMQGILEEGMIGRFDTISTHANFIMTNIDLMFKFDDLNQDGVLLKA